MRKTPEGRNDEIAYRHFALGQTYAELEEIFGVSRQRIAQILKEEGWPQKRPVHLCECGNDIYSTRHQKCRACRRAPKPKNRLTCQYCHEPGGYEVPACAKHRWRWYYHHAPNAAERRAAIIRAGRRQ